MNERDFQQQRSENWDRLEELVESLNGRDDIPLSTAREALQLYRRTAADLAEAQSRFPESALRERLELVVARSYGVIYGAGDREVGLRKLVLHALPRTFRANLSYFAVALACFALGVLLGAILVGLDASWAELYLPPSAIEEMKEGRLWTRFLSVAPASVLSSVIFYNNALVCFSAFVLGLTFGLGTLYVVFTNGLMLGSVLALCRQHGLLGELGTFVVGHGVLEISAILLSAAAGLMLGDALARPGPLKRLDALRSRAREAVILAAGAIPFLAFAGAIEGFVSPASLPPFLKYALGISAGCVMYAYLLIAGRPGREQ